MRSHTKHKYSCLFFFKLVNSKHFFEIITFFLFIFRFFFENLMCIDLVVIFTDPEAAQTHRYAPGVQHKALHSRFAAHCM